MCLIAYVPKGKSLTREVIDNANRVNPDGIGVMSAQGVEKFYGNKQLKRARVYIAGLAKEGLSHAVHWRFATHGARGLALCHPFKLPNVEAWMMHNGVIGSTAKDADEDASDTLLYVNKLIDAPSSHEDLDYWNKICSDMGRSNKGIVMYEGGKFVTLNADEGITIDGIWYSNQYSLPSSMKTGFHFVPTRMRPASQGYTTGGYYNRSTGMFPTGGQSYFPTSTRASDYGGPYGTSIIWSYQHNSYGFWEGMTFQKLKVEKGELIDMREVYKQRDAERQAQQQRIDETPRTGEDDSRKCPLCMRFKKDPPQGFLACWCPEDRLERYYREQATREAAKAPEKPAMPSGPTLEVGEHPEEKPAPKPSTSVCEHGNDNWEDCRECLAELEVDNASEVQRWLAERAGAHRIVRAVDGKVIYLPRVSEK